MLHYMRDHTTFLQCHCLSCHATLHEGPHYLPPVWLPLLLCYTNWGTTLPSSSVTASLAMLHYMRDHTTFLQCHCLSCHATLYEGPHYLPPVSLPLLPCYTIWGTTLPSSSVTASLAMLHYMRDHTTFLQCHCLSCHATLIEGPHYLPSVSLPLLPCYTIWGTTLPSSSVTASLAMLHYMRDHTTFLQCDCLSCHATLCFLWCDCS